MNTKVYHVDAFTSKPFSGNPAAVCLLEKAIPDATLQNIAAEMNLSETAFLLSDKNGFQLRWFTPKVEVDLCGHATLASAHVLFKTGKLGPDETAKFFTKSGELTAIREHEWIVLNFPAQPPVPDQISPAGLRALGIQSEPLAICRYGDKYLIELETEKEVRGLEPDFPALLAAMETEVIVTSLSSNPRYDFISRFFAPAAGVNEDPVTGSAHCLLMPYWGSKLGKRSLLAFQASARGGELKLRWEGERVIISGQAVLVSSGELLI